MWLDNISPIDTKLRQMYDHQITIRQVCNNLTNCWMLCKRSEAETSILVGCRIYLVFSASLVAHKSDKSDLSDLPNHVSPHGCWAFGFVRFRGFGRRWTMGSTKRRIGAILVFSKMVKRNLTKPNAQQPWEGLTWFGKSDKSDLSDLWATKEAENTR